MFKYIFWDRGVISGLFALLVPLFFYLALDGYLENRGFRLHGKIAVVEPGFKIDQGQYNQKKSIGQEAKQYAVYEAEATFTTEDGRKVTVRKPLSPFMYDQFTRGSRVEILYVSTRPEQTRFVLENDDQNVLAALILGLASLGVCMFLGKKPAK